MDGKVKLHHVGIVVNDLDAYGVACASFLGLSPDSVVFHDPIQKVRIQLWRDSHHNLLELIQPAASDSPVTRALQKGGGLNHLCYEVEEMEHRVHDFVQKGAILAGSIAPAVAFAGRRVAFLYFPKLGLIEFLEALPQK
jgi:methylmalonyl-CoA/ethylmalonyl-CoA epimerase